MTSTAYERIITRLREPGWHTAVSFGNDYHKLATRVGELNKRGMNIAIRKRRRDGKTWWEYRMQSIV